MVACRVLEPSHAITSRCLWRSSRRIQATAPTGQPGLNHSGVQKWRVWRRRSVREEDGRHLSQAAQQRAPARQPRHDERFDKRDPLIGMLARHISGFQKGPESRRTKLWGIDNPTDNLTGRSDSCSAQNGGKNSYRATGQRPVSVLDGLHKPHPASSPAAHSRHGEKKRLHEG